MTESTNSEDVAEPVASAETTESDGGERSDGGGDETLASDGGSGGNGDDGDDGPPEMPPARVDHVGIAVEEIGAAEPTLFALGCERVHREEHRGFEWATYVLGDASRLELIAPVGGQGEDESFLTEFLEANGPGLHHVTLEVTDVDSAVAALEAAGERVVGRRHEADWSEAFVSPRNPTGTLFQLMEYHDNYRERGDPEALYVRGRPLKE